MSERGKELAAEYAKNTAELTPEQRAEREAHGYWDITIDVPREHFRHLSYYARIYDDRTGDAVLDAYYVAIEMTGSEERIILRRLRADGKEDTSGEWVAERGNGASGFLIEDTCADRATIRAAMKWKESPALSGDPAKLAQLVREAIEAETIHSAQVGPPGAKVVHLDRLRARLPWLF